MRASEALKPTNRSGRVYSLYLAEIKGGFANGALIPFPRQSRSLSSCSEGKTKQNTAIANRFGPFCFSFQYRVNAKRSDLVHQELYLSSGVNLKVY